MRTRALLLFAFCWVLGTALVWANLPARQPQESGGPVLGPPAAGPAPRRPPDAQPGAALPGTHTPRTTAPEQETAPPSPPGRAAALPGASPQTLRPGAPGSPRH